MPTFMKTQVRFSALGAANPSAASALFTKTVLDAKTVSIIMRVLLGKKKRFEQN